jgi:hypothetical protein
MSGPYTAHLADDCGTILADGSKALAYRHRQIDPYLELCEKVVLDFSGVRSANSSFMNALISGLLEQHGEQVLEKLVFKSCKPAIAVLVEAAIELGISKSVARIAA